MGRHNSVSPVRNDRSPRRRSPSRRERSPARVKGKSPPKHRSSNADRLSSRTRSPKRARSRSPASHSPVRERLHTRTKPPNLKKSPSRSPVHARQKTSIRTRSPNREKSRSPPPLSPRSKRLKRAKSERDAEKGSEREYEKNHNRKSGKAAREEDDLPTEKKERRSGRDAAGNGSRSRHERSHSPSDRHRVGQRRSRSPSAADSRGRNELTNSRDDEDRSDGESEALVKMRAVEESLEAKEKQHKPSFELSGKLAAETNRVKGVTLLFNEPPDARKPEVRWRLYVFKGGEVLNDPLYVHRQSCYLFGRERRVADIPTDHPSCSKQHSVLQYRQVEEENPDGGVTKRMRPYLMDLGSTNGTFVNDERLEPQRYYELFEKDTIKFGNSSREYVLLHENSTG
ncbi:FHA domain-containing protein DDL-like isoform X1 [Salvia splendens]|uniref:FHA domain-containing protein DDL-like isoform X1 n=1 Tax=Salvia splendens TaxID=180675 RepID=UPI001C26E9ED|nr:FHA domain-containing protein DDL-like isoform X1 [Salvia splendens]